MELAIWILTGLLGWTAGYAFGQVMATARQRKNAGVRWGQPDWKQMRQYQNLIQFDGTGKGQRQLDD